MKYRILFTCLLAILLADIKLIAQQSLYVCQNGEVTFVSDANLEIIEATSSALKGILDPSTNRFAFSIDIISFTGFNSALQLEHFRENYMEISKFTKATFEGRLIEQVNLLEPGTHQVRAKGNMTIHGKSREIFVACQLSSGESIHVNAEFTISISDYNISIPKVVSKKVSEEITIRVVVDLKRNE